MSGHSISKGLWFHEAKIRRRHTVTLYLYFLSSHECNILPNCRKSSSVTLMQSITKKKGRGALCLIKQEEYHE